MDQKSTKNQSKMDQKSIKNRPKSRSGGLRGRFGGLLGRLGRSKASLEASWTVLEASWRRLGGVLEASWAVLGRERWPTWLQLGSQNRVKINKKSIPNLINFLNASWNRFLEGFWKIFGCQHEAKLSPTWDQTSMLTSNGDFSKNFIFPNEQ